MATAKKKIAPPAPRVENDRQVEVPPTIGRYDTTAGDGVSKSKTRADFREEEFVRVIRQHGKRVIWRKSLLCPCFNPETEQATVDCTDCNADGYLYVQPVVIQALMMQFDEKTSIFQKFGIYQEGNVSVTVEPKYRLGYRDSLEMIDAVIPMNELLTKGNRRGRRRHLPAGHDSARFRILNVAAIIHRANQAITALQEGIHFQVTDEGWLKWRDAGHSLVPDGGVLSVHYDFHPIYMIQSWQHVTRDDTSGRKVRLGRDRIIAHPIQAMAKLDFLVDVNGLPSMAQDVANPSGLGRGGIPDGP